MDSQEASEEPLAISMCARQLGIPSWTLLAAFDTWPFLWLLRLQEMHCRRAGILHLSLSFPSSG